MRSVFDCVWCGVCVCVCVAYLTVCSVVCILLLLFVHLHIVVSCFRFLLNDVSSIINILVLFEMGINLVCVCA